MIAKTRLSFTLAAGLGLLASLPAEAFECPRLDQAASASEGHGAMIQGSDGWFFRVGPDLTWRFFLGDEALGYLARMTGALERKGTRLIYAAVPPRGLAEYAHVPKDQPGSPILTDGEGAELYAHFLQSLERVGVAAPDILTPALASDVAFFQKRDHHWTAEGARLTARTLSEAIRARDLLSGLDSAEIVSRETGHKEFKGTIGQTLSRYCDEAIPSEILTTYETTQAASDAEDLGLFSDPDESPEIVLLGTSFSDSQLYNFDGFLSEELGVTIANRSISGGRFSNSAISYFSSEAFSENPPDAIIWELPIYYNVSGSLLDLRQMVPAIAGACPAERALGSVTAPLSSRPSVTLAAAEKVSGAGNYAYIRLDDPTVTRVNVEIRYDDGETETVPIDRSGRFEHEGRFFLEFSPDITAPVTEVQVSAEVAGGSDASSDTAPDVATEIRLCTTPENQQAG